MHQPQHTNEDKISELPEGIIHKIFSLLDSKAIVQSSVYSNKWKHLWKFTQTLSFNLDAYAASTQTKQIDFVDGVLSLRDHNSNIRTFTLSSRRQEITPSRLCIWILALLRSRVQQLYLDVNLSGFLELPDLIFTSDLKALKLSKYGPFGVQLPISMASSANIKTLELIVVQFPNGNSENKLTLNCPILESLVMIDCNLSHLEFLNISLPGLENLVFVNDFDQQSHCQINVCTPKLKSFKFRSPLFGEFSFEGFPAIVTADIDVYRMRYYGIEKEVYALRLMKVLSRLSTVEQLTLSASLVKTLTKLRATLEKFPDIFCNVKCMELTSQGDDKTCICPIASLLERLPKVETLIFERNKTLPSKEEILERFPYFANNLEDPGLTKRCDSCICKVMDKLPESEAQFWEERKARWLGSTNESEIPGEALSSQPVFHMLKTIEMRNPQGSDDELTIMKYLLHWAKALKKIHITAAEMSPVDRKNKLSELHKMVAELQ